MKVSNKRHISANGRLVTGSAFNLLLLYWVSTFARKTFSSTQFHYIAIDLARDAVSCFLPLLAIPLLFPVILAGRGWQRLLACALLVFPITFSGISCYLYAPEFLSDR